MEELNNRMNNIVSSLEAKYASVEERFNNLEKDMNETFLKILSLIDNINDRLDKLEKGE